MAAIENQMTREGPVWFLGAQARKQVKPLKRELLFPGRNPGGWIV